MPKISKQKLLTDKDDLEILRFAFYADPVRVKEQFLEIGIIIITETDLEKFVDGMTPFGTRHMYNVKEFVNNVKFRHELLQFANIEIV